MTPPHAQPAAAMAPRAGAAEVALLFLLALIWGSSFTIIRVVVPHLPPLSLTLWRVAAAALVLAAAAFWRGESFRYSARGWFWIVLAGITGNVLPFTLIAWGEERIDSGLAAILISIAPLMVLLLAHFLTRDERITLPRALGMALGFAGVLVLIGPQSLLHLGEETLRQLAVAAAAFCYAVNTLIVRHLQLVYLDLTTGMRHWAHSRTAHRPAPPPNHPISSASEVVGRERGASKQAHGRTGPVALAAAIMATSALVLLPFVPWKDGLVLPPPGAAAWAVTLGVVHTALATLIMFAIIARAGATFFASINFLIPVVGYLLGVLALGEPFSWRAVASLALVLAGIWLASRAARSRSRAARAASHHG